MSTYTHSLCGRTAGDRRGAPGDARTVPSQCIGIPWGRAKQASVLGEAVPRKRLLGGDDSTDSTFRRVRDTALAYIGEAFHALFSAAILADPIYHTISILSRPSNLPPTCLSDKGVDILAQPLPWRASNPPHPRLTRRALTRNGPVDPRTRLRKMESRSSLVPVTTLETHWCVL